MDVSANAVWAESKARKGVRTGDGGVDGLQPFRNSDEQQFKRGKRRAWYAEPSKQPKITTMSFVGTTTANCSRDCNSSLGVVARIAPLAYGLEKPARR